MNLRLIKIFLPLESRTKADEILRESDINEFWHDRISDKKVLIRALVLAENIEEFLDKMETEFSDTEDFRTVILPVEASIPRFQDEEEEREKKLGENNKKPERINREELYSNISANAKSNSTYLILIILASIVAAIGLVQGNVPMVVGAMIIAPLLGPSVGLSLGTVLGDLKLTLRSLKTIILGVLVGLLFSLFVGYLFSIDPEVPEIALRTEAGMGDVIVSLASGVVGVLSFTTGTLTALAGVMVAASLLPPLVTIGMLLGGGFTSEMTGALLLFIINLICINLAGVITFLIQKISPRTQWESIKAKALTIAAVSFWALFLLIILAIVFL